MPKVPEGYADMRRDEILRACDALYSRSSFHDVTIKEISAYTSFSRPSIYNYFRTIEEIFLGLLQREYELWTQDLLAILRRNDLTVQTLADALAHSLDGRRTLLRIQSTNLYEIEENSRLERLIEFKRCMQKAMNTLMEILKKSVPAMQEADRIHFMYSFFPFLYGVYPYTAPTDKQCQAMDAAGIPHRTLTIYELVYPCLLKLLR
ncbi:MAG: TetR family transcriptional regulator [Lachnospiraceae bacterium]|jgi:AcrR family transcriptional regulator